MSGLGARGLMREYGGRSDAGGCDFHAERRGGA